MILKVLLQLLTTPDSQDLIHTQHIFMSLLSHFKRIQLDTPVVFDCVGCVQVFLPPLSYVLLFFTNLSSQLSYMEVYVSQCVYVQLHEVVHVLWRGRMEPTVKVDQSNSKSKLDNFISDPLQTGKLKMYLTALYNLLI